MKKIKCGVFYDHMHEKETLKQIEAWETFWRKMKHLEYLEYELNEYMENKFNE